MLDLLSPEEVGEVVVDDEQPTLLHMELSECAFYGTTARRTIHTMKLDGVLAGQNVKFLLDSGSTHNFVDSRLLKKWGWQS